MIDAAIAVVPVVVIIVVLVCHAIVMLLLYGCRRGSLRLRVLLLALSLRMRSCRVMLPIGLVVRILV